MLQLEASAWAGGERFGLVLEPKLELGVGAGIDEGVGIADPIPIPNPTPIHGPVSNGH